MKCSVLASSVKTNSRGQSGPALAGIRHVQHPIWTSFRTALDLSSLGWNLQKTKSWLHTIHRTNERKGSVRRRFQPGFDCFCLNLSNIVFFLLTDINNKISINTSLICYSELMQVSWPDWFYQLNNLLIWTHLDQVSGMLSSVWSELVPVTSLVLVWAQIWFVFLSGCRATKWYKEKNSKSLKRKRTNEARLETGRGEGRGGEERSGVSVQQKNLWELSQALVWSLWAGGKLEMLVGWAAADFCHLGCWWTERHDGSVITTSWR